MGPCDRPDRAGNLEVRGKMTGKQGIHASEDQLESYALGRLPQQELAPLEEHLLVCEACQDRLREVDSFIAAFREAVRREEPQAAATPASDLWGMIPRWLRLVAGWRTPVWGAALAALLLIALVVPSRDGGRYEEVSLRALRGPAAAEAATASSSHLLELRLDLRGIPPLPAYRVEVVTEEGRVRFAAKASASGDELRVRLDSRLSTGRYWVRVSTDSAAPELLREYGLRTR